MKKISFCLLVILFLFNNLLFSQTAQGIELDDIQLNFNTTGDTLTIHIMEEGVKEFDVFLYKSYEEITYVKNELKNPHKIPISEWDRGMYHIKIDYGSITQFRNIEIF